nr:immunoglobulin heavy chain junction region [Macaca mulatta]MOW24772.1 immunoglobulin heavy chain junction region [Macaca mulatta]MOW25185.1 immunoglobulin heavy chain junction region [Macaca mulatta]MOW26464.1 immunoglobulin heavy chain junction region [Macaca mulatta]
CTGRKGGDEFW